MISLLLATLDANAIPGLIQEYSTSSDNVHYDLLAFDDEISWSGAKEIPKEKILIEDPHDKIEEILEKLADLSHLKWVYLWIL